MSTSLAVLHIEDNVDDHVLVMRALRQGGYDVKATRLETPEEMRAALAAQPWDIILCDHKLPHFDSFGALQVLKESGLDLPFIIVSGAIAGEVAVEAMRLGAQDFIFKENLTRLVPAIQRELREAEVRRAHGRAEENIRRQAGMLESVNDAMVASDAEYRITAWNPAAESLYGWKADEVLGRKGLEITCTEWPEADAESMRRTIAEQGRWLGEATQQRKDGTRFPVEISSRVLTDITGQITGYVSVNRDISRRKQAEQTTLGHLRRLAALRAIDTAISSTFDLRVTLNFLLQQVTLQLGVDAAAVLLLERGIQELRFSAQHGFRGTGINTVHLRLGEDYAGRAALERRSIYLPSIALAEPPFSHPGLTKDEGFVAYYAVPLIAKGQVKGVLEVFHRSPLSPDSEWTDFLETLAGQTAIAMDNAELFGDLQQSNAEMLMAYDRTIEGWSRAMDLRDKETEGHTLRVTEMTLELARKMRFEESELLHVRRGALLHDMGKLGVPDSILLKPGKLTEEEWVIMRQHPTYAYEMLSPVAYLKPAMDIPYCHHEKWDGTGYPRGLRGEQIPLAARIFAVIDVWDALMSDRPYRKAWTREAALRHISEQAGTHFDPDVVELFLKEAPIGTK